MVLTPDAVPSEIWQHIGNQGLSVSDCAHLTCTSQAFHRQLGRTINKVAYNLLHNIWRQEVFSIPPQPLHPTISRLMSCVDEPSRFICQNFSIPTELTIDIRTQTALQKTRTGSFQDEKTHTPHAMSARTWSVQVRSFLAADPTYLPGLWRDYATNDKLIALLDLNGKLEIYSHERNGPPRHRVSYPQVQGTALSFNNEGDKLVIVAAPHLFRRNWHVIVLDLNADLPAIPFRDSKGLYYIRDTLEVVGKALFFIAKKIAGFIFNFALFTFSIIVMAAPHAMKITIAATVLTLLSKLFVVAISIKLITATFLAYSLLTFGPTIAIAALVGLVMGIKSLLT